MFFRLIASAGIFALGYYIGREVGRMEPIIAELEKARDARVSHAGTYDHESPTQADEDASAA
jgi:hypothetical protein